MVRLSEANIGLLPELILSFMTLGIAILIFSNRCVLELTTLTIVVEQMLVVGLNVVGAIRGTEVIVDASGCDFVFDSAYHRMSFEDQLNYFKSNKHLHEIPPAVEID